MTLYVESPKNSIQKLLELVNEFSKVAGYIINAQKYVVFLCTNNVSGKKLYKLRIESL